MCPYFLPQKLDIISQLWHSYAKGPFCVPRHGSYLLRQKESSADLCSSHTGPSTSVLRCHFKSVVGRPGARLVAPSTSQSTMGSAWPSVVIGNPCSSAVTREIAPPTGCDQAIGIHSYVHSCQINARSLQWHSYLSQTIMNNRTVNLEIFTTI